MIPETYLMHAELARIRYTLSNQGKHSFDYWFVQNFGYEYGQQPIALPPHLLEVFPRHKNPAWLDEWYNEYKLQEEILTMLSTQQIQNTIVFLSRVPCQGVNEANELVTLVQFYQSLLPENSGTDKGSTIPESDNASDGDKEPT